MNYNILYNNRIIHRNIPEEEMRMILISLSEQAADNKINPELIDVEVID